MCLLVANARMEVAMIFCFPWCPKSKTSMDSYSNLEAESIYLEVRSWQGHSYKITQHNSTKFDLSKVV
jgi:hypothetical protein